MCSELAEFDFSSVAPETQNNRKRYNVVIIYINVFFEELVGYFYICNTLSFCGGFDRPRSASCSQTSSKACREKLRRERLNDKCVRLFLSISFSVCVSPIFLVFVSIIYLFLSIDYGILGALRWINRVMF